jgi:hypothetical protein
LMPLPFAGTSKIFVVFDILTKAAFQMKESAD